ncbi:hypothetical protein GGS21DRAFT_515487 [Xylaria nigripes]|nr:hypothetical protein GGS21DRAFT_515487 [Xylaria nigripes]
MHGGGVHLDHVISWTTYTTGTFTISTLLSTFRPRCRRHLPWRLMLILCCVGGVGWVWDKDRYCQRGTSRESLS